MTALGRPLRLRCREEASEVLNKVQRLCLHQRLLWDSTRFGRFLHFQVKGEGAAKVGQKQGASANAEPCEKYLRCLQPCANLHDSLASCRVGLPFYSWPTALSPPSSLAQVLSRV